MRRGCHRSTVSGDVPYLAVISSPRVRAERKDHPKCRCWQGSNARCREPPILPLRSLPRATSVVNHETGEPAWEESDRVDEPPGAGKRNPDAAPEILGGS
jgi:hypothetical protein